MDAENHRQAANVRSQQITDLETRAAHHRARAAELRVNERIVQAAVSALKRNAVDASRCANEAELRHEQAVKSHAAQEHLVNTQREALGEARRLVAAERSMSAGDAERAAREAQEYALEAEKYAAEALALAERAKCMAAR